MLAVLLLCDWLVDEDRKGGGVRVGVGFWWLFCGGVYLLLGGYLGVSVGVVRVVWGGFTLYCGGVYALLWGCLLAIMGVSRLYCGGGNGFLWGW